MNATVRRAVTAYIGLGSNLQGPMEQIRCALEALSALPETRCSAVSSIYSSPPMGPPDQPDYLNAVARISTRLSPLELLDQLQQIEQRQGRVRQRHWGERTLDLDLLLYGDEQIDHPRLKVPHPGIAERAFVLVPLKEITAEEALPLLGELEPLLRGCDSSRLRRCQ